MRRSHFPYCLKRMDDGSWVVLNRNFKPIGITTTDRVDYTAVPVSFRSKRLTPRVLRMLSHELNPKSLNHVYMYDKNAPPERDPIRLHLYMQKLQILMGITEDRHDHCK